MTYINGIIYKGKWKDDKPKRSLGRSLSLVKHLLRSASRGHGRHFEFNRRGILV
jgi:hypothetical protein